MTRSDNQLENRSEILFLFDAMNANPNGNPKGDNRPRIDPQTQQCIITDVRLKRYIRDQLAQDEHGVFVKQMGGDAQERIKLALDMLEGVESEEDLDDIKDIIEEFLDAAADARYFGALFSFNKTDDDDFHDEITNRFPSHLTGPVQFMPARSLNSVELNTEFNTLTSVIATKKGKDTGGYGLDDHRIKYGVFPFRGIVDEHGAEHTMLSEEDVERLDTLVWRSLRNQALSRSKIGQEPRLYLRVESSTDGFHIGDIHTRVSIDEERSVPDTEMRNISDVVLDCSDLLNALEKYADHIKTVHVVGDERLEITDRSNEVHTADALSDLIEDTGVDVHRIDVYNEFTATLPQ